MPVKYQDYYDTLGVERNATQAQIKSAYRKLARKYHPDINKDSDAEDRFKQVNEANEVLGDPEKRNVTINWARTGRTGRTSGPLRAGKKVTPDNAAPLRRRPTISTVISAISSRRSSEAIGAAPVRVPLPQAGACAVLTTKRA